MIATILTCIVVTLLVLPLFLFEGWVATCIWEWFFVPLGLPVIPLVHMMGIMLTISFLKKDKEEKSKIPKDAFVIILENVIKSLMILGMAWLVTLFM